MELKTSEIQDKRSAVLRMGESQLEEVMELSRQLDSIRDEFAMISEAFEVKMGGMRVQLERLREMRREKEEIAFRASELSKEFSLKSAVLRRQVEEDSKKVSTSTTADRELIAKLNSLEPHIRKMRMLKEELDAYLENVNRKSDELGRAIDAREKEYEQMRAGAESSQKRLSAADAMLRELKTEVQGRVDELGSLSKAGEEGAKGAMAGMDKSIAEAETLVRDFDVRIDRLRKMDAELKRLNAEKKELSDYLQKIVTELRSLDFAKGTMSIEEVLTKIDESKTKISEAGKKREKYAHRQRELQSSLKGVWKIEGEKKG